MKCQDCGKEGAEETICPYADEINDELVEICVCDSCYQQRADDI